MRNWTYTTHGNLATAQDGKGNVTTNSYDSNDLYLTGVAAPLSRATSYSFDGISQHGTGLLVTTTDYNALTETPAYDNLGREIQLDESGSSGLLRRTTTTYEDANRRVITKTDSMSPGDQQIVSVTDYDQLGRVRLSRQLEPGGQNPDDDTVGIKVQTRYGYSNPLSYRIVSNPYRADKSSDAGSEATMGWTVTTSDWSRRLSTVTAYGGAGVPSTPVIAGCPASGSQITCYSDNTTTASDEGGVTRVNTVDGLGRLTQVVENGIGATTTNAYDVLGNLTGITHSGFAVNCSTPQGGSANRSFFYDSLGRLSKACNPESGTTTYGYDDNSNQTSRTDARGLTATFGYDAVNRLISKNYPAGTPSVTYTYPSGQDFLSSVSSSASTYTYSGYDAMARPGAGTQNTGGQQWTFSSIQWTPGGKVKSLTHPSTRIVTTTYDATERPIDVSGTLNGVTTHYLTGTLYATVSATRQPGTGV